LADVKHGFARVLTEMERGCLALFTRYLLPYEYWIKPEDLISEDFLTEDGHRFPWDTREGRSLSVFYSGLSRQLSKKEDLTEDQKTLVTILEQFKEKRLAEPSRELTESQRELAKMIEEHQRRSINEN